MTKDELTEKYKDFAVNELGEERFNEVMDFGLDALLVLISEIELLDLVELSEELDFDAGEKELDFLHDFLTSEFLNDTIREVLS